jgi:hypothetical protein
VNTNLRCVRGMPFDRVWLSVGQGREGTGSSVSVAALSERTGAMKLFIEKTASFSVRLLVPPKGLLDRIRSPISSGSLCMAFLIGMASRL